MMSTPLEVLVSEILKFTDHNSQTEMPPEVILWCDESYEFWSIISMLRNTIPELMTLGEYDKNSQTGPAVWLRAAATGAVDGIPISKSKIPILYLPGIGRETLKNVADCPTVHQPLVWYTISGIFFGQVNEKDWTLHELLTSKHGPFNFKIVESCCTIESLKRVAKRFFSLPMDELQDKQWDAELLNSILVSDVYRDMLDWICGMFNEQTDLERFTAFKELSVKKLDFDPSHSNPISAAKLLVQKQENWINVWNHFEETDGYEEVINILNGLKPNAKHRESFPQINENAESELRKEFFDLELLSYEDAKSRVFELESIHAWRRETVWFRRNMSPLAKSLKHLNIVARANFLPSQYSEEFIKSYVDVGADIDWAAMMALASTKLKDDRKAVGKALRSIYLPWLENGAQSMQELVKKGKLKLATPENTGSEIDVLLFVDGLRMDLAKYLVLRLSDRGFEVSLSWKLSGFPSVTATCKSLYSPIAETLSGHRDTKDFTPQLLNGTTLTQKVLLDSLKNIEWGTEVNLFNESNLWLEIGEFDSDGHKLGARLVERLTVGLQDVENYVVKLVNSGRDVNIHTDHGWLLMPDGLPKVELDNGLLKPDGKRTRCALVKPNATSTYLNIPWSWNNEVFVATATGVNSFYSKEYAHGGISPQECIIPRITIKSSNSKRQIYIEKIDWKGLRIHVSVNGGSDVTIQLKTENFGEDIVPLSIERDLDENGHSTILVSDIYEGKQATLSVFDESGQILDEKTLTIGAD